MKHFEGPSDYKKAILTVAVVGGVGIGAGLIARRLWRSKTGGENAEKASGDNVSKTTVATGQVSKTSAEAQPSLQPSKPVQPESLTTSGTFVKVPIPVADSLEQRTVSQSVPTVVEKPGTEVKVLQPVKPGLKTPSGGATAPSAQDAARLTMKDNNDIVVVETESSGTGASVAGKTAPTTPVKTDPPVQPSTQPPVSTVDPLKSVAAPAKSSTSAVVGPTPQLPPSTSTKI